MYSIYFFLSNTKNDYNQKFIFNFILLSKTIKFNSNGFLPEFDKLVKSKWYDSKTDVLEIPEEYKEDFTNVFLKKFKYFFFKNVENKSTTTNTNLFSNFLVYNNFFKKMNTINYSNFKIKKKCIVLFKRKKLFFKNMRISNLYFTYNNCSNRVYTFLKKVFFKKNACFLKKQINSMLVYRYIICICWYRSFAKRKTIPFVYRYFRWRLLKKKRYFNFFKRKVKKKTPHHLYKNFTDLTLNFFKKQQEKNIFPILKLKFFFLKNFFLFNNNNQFILNGCSNLMLNSYFYNCFFKPNNFNFNPEITNHTPFNILNNSLKKKIFSKININYTPNFYKYIYHTISGSIESFLKKKFFLKIFSKIKKDSLISERIDDLFFKNKSLQSRIGRGFFLHEMLDVIYITFVYKDLNFLIKWFVKTMYRISFKSHKKFISAFKQILVKNFEFFSKNTNVSGFFFDIRGKVGVTGNAKTRNFFFHAGNFSKTTKKNKFDYQFDIVKTPTGAFGITMYLSYR